jgi:hypothetical protein
MSNLNCNPIDLLDSIDELHRLEHRLAGVGFFFGPDVDQPNDDIVHATLHAIERDIAAVRVSLEALAAANREAAP